MVIKLSSDRIQIYFLCGSGAKYTWNYRIDAFYAILREGGLPEDIERIIHVIFPGGASWQAPECERSEQATMLCSMLKHYLPGE